MGQKKVKTWPVIKYRRDLWQLLEEPGAAAEIGVAEGNNSEDMLRWLLDTTTSRNKVFRTKTPAITKLYMVDRWRETPDQAGDAAMPQEWHDKNLRRVRTRTAPYGNRAVMLRGNSVDMADEVPDGSLALLYIDGDHSFEGCFADLRAWTPKVKRGGIVALHDFLNENYGVRKAVEAFCANNFKIHIIEEDKPEDAGAWFQIC